MKKQKILKNVAKMLFSVLYMGQKASIIRGKEAVNCQSKVPLYTSKKLKQWTFTLTKWI